MSAAAEELLLTPNHSDTHWVFMRNGPESVWSISVAHHGSDPRLSVRHRNERGAFGAEIDCGFIGSPRRFGTWKTEAEFRDFCLCFTGVRPAPAPASDPLRSNLP